MPSAHPGDFEALRLARRIISLQPTHPPAPSLVARRAAFALLGTSSFSTEPRILKFFCLECFGDRGRQHSIIANIWSGHKVKDLLWRSWKHNWNLCYLPHQLPSSPIAFINSLRISCVYTMCFDLINPHSSQIHAPNSLPSFYFLFFL